MLMSLFSFGFKHLNTNNFCGSRTESQDVDVPDCMPTLEESRGLGLGVVEYKTVLNNMSDAVMNNYKKQRDTQSIYSNEDRAKNRMICIGEWQ